MGGVNALLRVLETALPVFVMLGIGMLCRAKRVLNQAGVDALKSVAVNIALPAVLFNAFAAADYSGNAIAVPILMFFVCCAALALGFLGARIFHMRSRLAPFLMTGYEAGMLGYGLFVSNDTPEGLFGRPRHIRRTVWRMTQAIIFHRSCRSPSSLTKPKHTESQSAAISAKNNGKI